jgi:hypothetical protein
VGSQGRVCPGKEMTAALGPYGDTVDILDKATYALWRSRKGLRCMLIGCFVTLS